MQLWIDNTGLQSAALCLEGRASHAYDVRGLLQLATLVIYGNKVSLNGFEPNIIAKRSHEIIEELQTAGITEDILSISSVNESEYALACMTAADSIAPDLCDGFNPDEWKLIGGHVPDLPRGLQERQLKFVALANEQEGSTKLQEVEESALTDKATGAVEYMMACSPALREAVARILTMYPNWGDRNSQELNIFLRYHLNDALAQQSFSKYAPAIARAELVSRRNQYVIEALEETTVDKTVADLRSERLGIPKYAIEALGEIVHNTVTELRGKPLGIPSTLAALLERSKGEPQAIFKVAREFRDHSKPLRDALQTLIAKYPDDTSDSRVEIDREIKELGQQLRRDLGLEKATTLRDAVNVSFIIGVPVPSVTGKEFWKWVSERKLSKRTAVLTELVKASAESNFSTNFYEKLCKLAMTRPSRIAMASVTKDVVRLSREAGVESAPSDCAGQEVRDFDEELAERLLSESMDRLAIVAKDMSDLAAETAIDLALIETKRVQIDRAQAENWALLRELTKQAQ